MKKKLNIICALIFVVLLSSLAIHFSATAVGMRAGFNGNSHDDSISVGLPTEMVALPLYRTDVTHAFTQITIRATGQNIRIMDCEAIAICPTSNAGASMLMQAICGLCYAIFAIAALVHFVRFVMHINHSQIFVWDNVRRLRRLGLYLCLAFLFQMAPTIITYCTWVNKLIFDSYAVNWWYGLSNSNLLLGLISLLAAEVFAIGLRLQEEQDLTVYPPKNN